MSGITLFTGLRFHLSPDVGEADASRPVDGGPGSTIPCLPHNTVLRQYVAVISRRSSCFVPLLAQTRLLWILIRHKGYVCGVKVYWVPQRADSSPDEKKGGSSAHDPEGFPAFAATTAALLPYPGASLRFPHRRLPYAMQAR